MLKVLRSEIDESINFVKNLPTGKFESRYVRREENKASFYVSIQSGCNQGCRMCHLTKTKQTKFINATADDIIEQLKPVVEHYKKTVPANIVHINYMARGEFFDNPNVNKEFLEKISAYLDDEGIGSHIHLISTIMPLSLNTSVINSDPIGSLLTNRCRVYYSLYSTDPDWRRSWFPKAMSYTEALILLRLYSDKGGEVRIHLPFIKGQNDCEEEVRNIVRAVRDSELKCKFNIVRYNDFDGTYEESDYEHIMFLSNVISEYGYSVKVVTKVGEDVAASCGMFVK